MKIVALCQHVLGELSGGQTRFKGGGFGDKIIEYSEVRGRWEVLDLRDSSCLA